ncbi:hypothetical protein LOAG_07731 [Loa loa]|uniref:G-protein coupled receptors family 1 profile domain-containing protein n=1 Tax=Loa loa TaxID=7209 RepID=A0A1S0TWW8_LOALO|nr:hypothetical protein LOAG_07731 [Loa loa]EFO20760.1 hypothetical protein LOAG_07731 [Loa loa]
MKFIRNLGSISFPWVIFCRIVSPLANSTLYAAIWMHFALAINRLLAISSPIIYPRIFNPRNAWIIVVSLWSFTMLITALYYNVECVAYFESDIHSWSTLYGPCDHTFFAYIAMFLSDGIVIITIIIDAIAFYRIIVYLKDKNRQEAHGTQHRIKKEIIFFKETCISTIIYAFFVIIFRIELPMSRFSKIIYTWLAMFASDGLAFLYFNRRLLMKQNVATFRTNTRDLRTKIVKIDVNTTVKCTVTNNRVNIASMKIEGGNCDHRSDLRAVSGSLGSRKMYFVEIDIGIIWSSLFLVSSSLNCYIDVVIANTVTQRGRKKP